MTSKLSSGSGGVWCLIYSVHTSSVTLPLLAHPISPHPKVLAPVALPQYSELAQQFVRTATLQILDGARDREVRRYRDQHMDMIPIDRSGMHHHLVRPCCLAQQFATSFADIAAQYLMAIFRHPNQMIFAVPDRVAATLVRFHPHNLQRNRRDPSRLKAWGLPIPYSGTLKAWSLQIPLFGDSKRIPPPAEAKSLPGSGTQT